MNLLIIILIMNKIQHSIIYQDELNFFSRYTKTNTLRLFPIHTLYHQIGQDIPEVQVQIREKKPNLTTKRNSQKGKSTKAHRKQRSQGGVDLNKRGQNSVQFELYKQLIQKHMERNNRSAEYNVERELTFESFDKNEYDLESNNINDDNNKNEQSMNNEQERIVEEMYIGNEKQQDQKEQQVKEQQVKEQYGKEQEQERNIVGQQSEWDNEIDLLNIENVQRIQQNQQGGESNISSQQQFQQQKYNQQKYSNKQNNKSQIIQTQNHIEYQYQSHHSSEHHTSQTQIHQSFIQPHFQTHQSPQILMQPHNTSLNPKPQNYTKFIQTQNAYLNNPSLNTYLLSSKQSTPQHPQSFNTPNPSYTQFNNLDSPTNFPILKMPDIFQNHNYQYQKFQNILQQQQQQEQQQFNQQDKQKLELQQQQAIKNLNIQKSEKKLLQNNNQNQPSLFQYIPEQRKTPTFSVIDYQSLFNHKKQQQTIASKIQNKNSNKIPFKLAKKTNITQSNNQANVQKKISFKTVFKKKPQQQLKKSAKITQQKLQKKNFSKSFLRKSPIKMLSLNQDSPKFYKNVDQQNLVSFRSSDSSQGMRQKYLKV